MSIRLVTFLFCLLSPSWPCAQFCLVMFSRRALEEEFAAGYDEGQTGRLCPHSEFSVRILRADHTLFSGHCTFSFFAHFFTLVSRYVSSGVGFKVQIKCPVFARFNSTIFVTPYSLRPFSSLSHVCCALRSPFSALLGGERTHLKCDLFWP